MWNNLRVSRKRNAFVEWLGQLQASGRYTFTREDAKGEGPDVERKAIWRAQRAGLLIQPRSGFFVIVPAEYRAVGAPPAPWFIDDLMRYGELPYYVGLLSAAALYGVSPQAAQEFQVVAPRATRPIRAGRLRIRFLMRSDIGSAATVERPTPTGKMAVSTPEQTALDLVQYPHAAGGWDNVASVLAELAQQLDPEVLARTADRAAHPRPIQRLGHLLDVVHAEPPAHALADWVAPRALPYVPFEPSAPSAAAPRDQRWHLILNRAFEVE